MLTLYTDHRHNLRFCKTPRLKTDASRFLSAKRSASVLSFRRFTENLKSANCDGGKNNDMNVIHHSDYRTPVFCLLIRLSHFVILIFCNHSDTSFCAVFASFPQTARPSGMLDFGQSSEISATLRPRPLPRCVQNGATVFPEKSYSDKKVLTGAGNVPHQIG